MARPRVAERLLISVSRWQFRLLKPFETQKWKSLMGKKSDWKVHFSDSPGEIKSAISSGRKAPGTPTLWQSNRDNGRKGKGLPVQFDWLGIHRRITQQYVGKGLTRLSLFLWLRKKIGAKKSCNNYVAKKACPMFHLHLWNGNPQSMVELPWFSIAFAWPGHQVFDPIRQGTQDRNYPAPRTIIWACFF